MKKNIFLPNMLLVAVLLLACLIGLLLRVFQPAAVVPELNLPALVLLSLLALAPAGCMQKFTRRSPVVWAVSALLAAVTFALLPWAAGVIGSQQLVEFALLGGGSYLASGLLFASIQERLSSGSLFRMASIASAFMLFLASQCLAGILL